MIPASWKKWMGIPHPCKNPKSIFMGLVGGVGDLISAAPSVAALKRKYPEARITFGVGGGIFFSTIRNDPNIDRFETPFSYDVWKKGRAERSTGKNTGNTIWSCFSTMATKTGGNRKNISSTSIRKNAA